MKHWVIPTMENGYRAKLISTPILVTITLVLILTNWIIQPFSVVAASNDINAQGLLKQHNNQRKKFNLAPLRYSESLSNSAQRKASAMLKSNCWSHYCPPGKSPWEFFNEAGYTYVVAGENLAEGFYSLDAVMTAWMNSPTHRENILRADYEEVGFGILQGTFQNRKNNIVIAVHFGTPRPDRAGDLFDLGSGDLQTPEILSPQDGQSLNTNTVDISGLSGAASQISLYLGQERWRDVDANRGVFTYNTTLEEGEYTLSAVGRIGTRRSNRSKPVNFAVDTTPNRISADDIILLNNEDDNLKLSIVSPNLAELQLSFTGENQRAYQFENTEGDLWIGYIDQLEFMDSDTFTLDTTDQAGNEWSGQLVSQTILNAAELVRIDEDGDAESTGRIISVDIKSQFNMGAFLILLSLFGIDFYAVSRTGLTKYMGKSTMHFAIFLIILLITLSGAFTGQILEGVSI